MEWLIGDEESFDFYTQAFKAGLNFNDRTYATAIGSGGYLFHDVAPPSGSAGIRPCTYPRCARVFTWNWVSGGISGGATPPARAIYSLPRLEPVSSWYTFSQTTIADILTHFSLTPGGGTGVLAIYVVWLGWRLQGPYNSAGTPKVPKSYPLPGDSNSFGIALAARYRAQS